MTLYTKNASVWATATPYENNGGVWKPTTIYTNSGGVWKPVNGGVATLSVVSLTNTGNSNSASIAWAAHQAGDLAILFDVNEVFSSTPSAAVVPAGFTAIYNDALSSSVSVRSTISYRICDGTETGNIAGLSTGLIYGKALLIIRGDVPVSQVTWPAWNSQGTTGDPSPQTVAASGGTAPLIVLGLANGSGGGSAITSSPAFDATQTFAGSTIGALGYKIYNSAPANHTIDMGDKGNNLLGSGYIQIT